VVTYLIALKADVNIKRTDGCSPLFIAAQQGYLDIVTLLLETGANVDEKRDVEATPLYGTREREREIMMNIFPLSFVLKKT
jgi:ankyrin repeat protein